MKTLINEFNKKRRILVDDFITLTNDANVQTGELSDKLEYIRNYDEFIFIYWGLVYNNEKSTFEYEI